MSFIYHLIFYNPLYNALVFLTDKLPGNQIAVAVILLTILVRLVLLPFQHKSIHTQRKMREVDAKSKEIRAKFEHDKEQQTREILKLYKQHGVNPFSTFGLVLIQLPILIALYQVFRAPFSSKYLYSFVQLPAHVNFIWLGINLAAKNIPIALLVGISQFFQIRLSMPPAPAQEPGGKNSFSDELSRSMQTNMKYFMPVIITIIAATLPSVLAVYWVTSNIIMIAHELIVRRSASHISQEQS